MSMPWCIVGIPSCRSVVVAWGAWQLLVGILRKCQRLHCVIASRAIGLGLCVGFIWGEVRRCVGHGPLSVDGCPPTGGDHILSWICMSRCPLLGGGYLFGGALLTCWVNIEVSECAFHTLALVAYLPMLYWRKVPNMRCHICPCVWHMH